jgi:membrane-associated phospholipid phosphatase
MWHAAAYGFFVYAAILAIAIRGLTSRRRAAALLGAAAGFVLTTAAIAAPIGSVARDWLLPPAVLLTAYWASGSLFVAPQVRIERAFMAVDRALHVTEGASRVPRWLTWCLELAYGGVYALVPVALALQLLLSTNPDVERFWTAVLLVDFICFAMLPWIQTRPPRALEAAAPWQSPIRTLNVRVLGATSIQVNTFPSGHAAEGLAAALLVVGTPLPVVAMMFLAAFAVSAGAVLGRYHYFVDAVSGWIVAIVVCAVIT